MEKKYKLEKEFAKKWLKALRSGKYEQSSEFLYEIDNGKEYFCCIGVAGVVCGVEKKSMYLKGLFGRFNKQLSNSKKIVPELYGEYTKNELVSELVDLNGENDFEAIAQWVEDNVEFV